MELDHYHQKVNVRVAKRVAERFLAKSCKKSVVKQSIEKPILLNFVNLSPTFCPLLAAVLRGISRRFSIDNYQVTLHVV